MKKLFLAAPLALAAGALLTSPASAASYKSPGQLRSEISQLDRQIDRSRGLTSTEERQLERRLDQVQSLYSRYARNGFSRAELSVLSTRVDLIRNQLYRQANDRNRDGRDWDRRDGWRDHR